MGGASTPLPVCVNDSLALSAGERMSAQEALSLGLISKVFPTESLVDEAIQLGERISGFSKIAVAMCKEAVNAAEQLPLNEGIRRKVYFCYFFLRNQEWSAFYYTPRLCLRDYYSHTLSLSLSLSIMVCRIEV